MDSANHVSCRALVYYWKGSSGTKFWLTKNITRKNEVHDAVCSVWSSHIHSLWLEPKCLYPVSSLEITEIFWSLHSIYTHTSSEFSIASQTPENYHPLAFKENGAVASHATSPVSLCETITKSHRPTQNPDSLPFPLKHMVWYQFGDGNSLSQEKLILYLLLCLLTDVSVHFANKRCHS